MCRVVCRVIREDTRTYSVDIDTASEGEEDKTWEDNSIRISEYTTDEEEVLTSSRVCASEGEV